MIPMIVIWILAGISAASLILAHGIYWYDACECKFWLDQHLER